MNSVLKYSFITLLILVLVESLFWGIQYSRGNSNGFLIHFENKKNEIQKVAYCETDALLGWSIARFGHFKEQNGDIVLTNSPEDTHSILIYISGGSTSDLMYDSLNWPRFLFEKCKEKKIPVTIRIAAVAGYNSGQELLKLISSDALKPDIHISYSGANEVEHPDYVSLYESEIFYDKFKQKTSFLLPNTIGFLKGLNNSKTTLKQRDLQDAFQFWKTNMNKMNQLAIGGNYTFFAVLQPVAGFRNKLPKEMPVGAKKYTKKYPLFYKKAVIQAKKEAYFIDLTDIFENENVAVFKDDCHLKQKKEQQKIADEIFKLCLSNLAKNQ